MGRLLLIGAVAAFVVSRHFIATGSGTENKYQPIGLKCPNENNRILEFLAKNELGESEKLEVRYGKGGPEYIWLYLSEPQQGFELLFQMRVGHPLEEGDEETGNKALRVVSPVKQRVCDGDRSYRKKFYKWMEDNRRRLKAISNEG
jgi:hypothetical protein